MLSMNETGFMKKQKGACTQAHMDTKKFQNVPFCQMWIFAIPSLKPAEMKNKKFSIAVLYYLYMPACESFI